MKIITVLFFLFNSLFSVDLFGIRYLSLSGGGSASPVAVEAPFLNPAGISQPKIFTSAIFGGVVNGSMREGNIDGISQLGASIALPVNKVLGAGISSYFYGNSSYRKWSTFFAAGISFKEKLDLGLTAVLVYSAVPTFTLIDDTAVKGGSKIGIGLNAGMLYHISEKSSVGITVRNIVSPDLGYQVEEKEPIEIQGGIAFPVYKGKLMVDGLVGEEPGVISEKKGSLILSYEIPVFKNRLTLSSGAAFIGMTENIDASLGFTFLPIKKISLSYSWNYSTKFNNFGSHSIGINYVPFKKPSIEREHENGDKE